MIAADQTGVIPAIYNEDPLQEPHPERVHIRGLDEFSEDDIKAFAQEHFPTEVPPRIQWIDDTAANLVYPSRDLALQAILSFTASSTTADDINNAPLLLRPSKPLSSHPTATLQVRIAMAGDKKKKGARHESRYYLFHPEADHVEYNRRRFDAREHRRRRDQDLHDEDDPSNNFSASMYDDAPATDGDAGESSTIRRGRSQQDLFSRISGPNARRPFRRRRSASPGRNRSANSDEIEIDDDSDDGFLGRRDHRRNRTNVAAYRDRSVRTPPPPYSHIDPNPFPKENFGKELFAHRLNGEDDEKQRGKLRSDKVIELFPSSRATSSSADGRLRSSRSEANAAAAQRLKADLLATTSPSQTPRPRHQRSNAMDAKTEQDLSNYTRKSLSIDSTKSASTINLGGNSNEGKELFGRSSEAGGMGLSIKGTAAMSGLTNSDRPAPGDEGIQIRGTGGFSIKGRATATVGKEEVRELFPEQYNKTGPSRPRNEGKELFAFDEPIRERRVRARAGDSWD